MVKAATLPVQPPCVDFFSSQPKVVQLSIGDALFVILTITMEIAESGSVLKTMRVTIARVVVAKPVSIVTMMIFVRSLKGLSVIGIQ